MPLSVKTVERPEPGVFVTGFDGPAKFIDVPSAIDGKKVIEIADRAFAERPDLMEVRIADGVRGIGRYAFYNCSHLRKIVLTDSVDGYGDGALRMCREVREIEVTMNRGYYRLIKEMLEDSEEELHLTLHLPDGKEARLNFPGYYSEIREDYEARVIHQSIRGAGFTYRQCVSRRGIDYEMYDGSFDRAVIAGEQTAGMIAALRLLYPVELNVKAADAYVRYLSEHAEGVILECIENGDVDTVSLMVGTLQTSDWKRDRNSSFLDLPPEMRIEISDAAFDAALEKASTRQETEICGILMEAVRARKSGGSAADAFSFEELSFDDF